MQRTSNDTMNSARLRATLRTWLGNAGKRPVWLAQEAGLNPSILSRFLNQKTQLDQVSALKLYKALQHLMTSVQRQDYLEAAGLLDLVRDLVEPPPVNLPPSQPSEPYHPLMTGMAYMRAAYAAPKTETADLFLAAERAFGPGSTNAAYAAIEAGVVLSIIGDVARAESELIRVGTQYADVMDIPTQEHYAYGRGYLEFDRASLGAADRWFRQSIAIAQHAGAPELIEESLVYMVLIPLEIARSAPDTPGLGARLAEADRWMEHIIQRDTAREPVWWGNYRHRALLRQAQGRHDDAQSDRRNARKYISHAVSPGQHHFHIDQAELALDLGDTAAARRLAIPSLEDWTMMRYSGGMARATRVLAMAALLDRDARLALELAVAAACINPFGTFQDRAKLDLVLRAARDDVRRELLPKDYTRLVKDLRAKAETQQGAFNPLSAVAPSRKTDLDAVFRRVAR
ncbi:MAG: hypothetical protein M1434_09505 [Chloroflexi bacterium]|nr:hypothetical protein [Chloroflexota bacterium]